MNYSETNNQTAKALQRFKQRNVFANNWEQSSKNVSALAISKKDVQKLKGGEDSFLARSEVFQTLVDQVNLDDMSLTDLIALSQAAKAIEDGDTKAATFLRDSAGCKPVEKVQKNTGNIAELTDDELDFLLANAEVIDESE